MRTTLTLDENNARQVRVFAQRAGISFKEAVNQLIAKGLRSTVAKAPATAFQVRPRPMGLRSGLDPQKLNQLADELEAEAFLDITHRLDAEKS